MRLPCPDVRSEMHPTTIEIDPSVAGRKECCRKGVHRGISANTQRLLAPDRAHGQGVWACSLLRDYEGQYPGWYLLRQWSQPGWLSDDPEQSKRLSLHHVSWNRAGNATSAGRAWPQSSISEVVFARYLSFIPEVEAEAPWSQCRTMALDSSVVSFVSWRLFFNIPCLRVGASR